MNEIIISGVQKDRCCITYQYEVHGPWSECFDDECFCIEYSCDITHVPDEILYIPLLTNLLPISWIYDATISLPVCDEDFYNCITDIKRGYSEMYPMISFNGKIQVERIINNNEEMLDGAVVFFSGGVDAFNTLVCHIDEKPLLMTLWGADVAWEDTTGWARVSNHTKRVAEDNDLDYVTVKTGFRRFISDSKLNKAVKCSRDGWWHGFQHGIGIIGHAAPIMYIKKLKTVYFASSFTIQDKGKVTCASDPTIDNHLRFFKVNVIHDGYEFTRQMKLNNITKYSNSSNRKILLRVCWQSTGGSNCVNCEKCWRTILGIFATGCNPKDYGFTYTNQQLRHLAFKMRYGENRLARVSTYIQIQEEMKKNTKKNELPRCIRWFYNSHIGKTTFMAKIIRSANKVRKHLKAS